MEDDDHYIHQNTNNNDNNNNKYTLDEAITSMGIGKFQWFALGYAGFGWMSDSMALMLLSFIGPAVQSQWKLSPNIESLLSTMVFIGTLLGSYFWGFISDSYGRRSVFLSYLCIYIYIYINSSVCISR